MIPDELLNDPTEAWAIISTFARSCLPMDRDAIVCVLDRMRRLVMEEPLLPDESVNVALVADLNLLNARIEQYQRSCRDVRDMMRIHHETWPGWKAEEPTP